MRFPGGKAKAATFSYDDGVKADVRLIELFNRYGLKGTFNLNSKLFDCACWHDRMDEAQTYAAYADSGHEIALHGARHIFLDKVPLPEAINEIVQNRLYLENKFGRIVRGMAYAYNGYNEQVIAALKMLGVTYARTTESTHGFDMPRDWLRLNPTCHHGDGQLFALADRFTGASPADETKHREPWLFYIWGHSYEFDDNGNWHVMETLARRLRARDDIWFATSGEICDYARAYGNLVYSLDGERAFNPSHLPVCVEIRGRVYEIGAGRAVEFEK